MVMSGVRGGGSRRWEVRDICAHFNHLVKFGEEERRPRIR